MISSEYLNIKQTAVKLGISEVTVKNWIKNQSLKPVFRNNKILFRKKDIENLLQKIDEGKLKRLSQRANKKKSNKTFIPKEYLFRSIFTLKIEMILYFIKHLKLDKNKAMFLLALNVAKKSQKITEEEVMSIMKPNFLGMNNGRNIIREFVNWKISLENFVFNSKIEKLINIEIPLQNDILGLIYQSILEEGEKNKAGSYYTPRDIVKKICSDYIKTDLKVLDLCCGTGQFLLIFAEHIKNPNLIHGIDIDPIAIRIARINLILYYADIEFEPNIFCANSIFDEIKGINNFDFIATNPPWGLHFENEEKEILQHKQSQITSFESFSYFIKRSIELLNPKGYSSFILPESILNVNTHKDIRKYILDNSTIEKIVFLDKVFKNVFTSVIRLDLSKGVKNNKFYHIEKFNEKYVYEYKNVTEDKNLKIQIHISDKELVILEKIFRFEHINLQNNAIFALGIITGNNKKYLSDRKLEGYEEIITGKEIDKFKLKKAQKFVQFAPEKYQQIAPMETYRAKEKIIYKFISDNPSFAYDNKQKLTLNSANIIISKLDNYPTKVILALFNSSLYKFILRKKFNSIKILRSHLEELPLPIWNNQIVYEIINLVDEILSSKNKSDQLDNLIFNLFDLTEEEIKIVKSIDKNNSQINKETILF